MSEKDMRNYNVHKGELVLLVNPQIDPCQPNDDSFNEIPTYWLVVFDKYLPDGKQFTRTYGQDLSSPPFRAEDKRTYLPLNGSIPLRENTICCKAQEIHVGREAIVKRLRKDTTTDRSYYASMLECVPGTERSLSDTPK